MLIGALLQSVGETKRDTAQLLARLQLQTIALSADMKSDSSTLATVSLHCCYLEDARLGRELGITKFVLLSLFITIQAC
jgi:hypothetical protein